MSVLLIYFLALEILNLKKATGFYMQIGTRFFLLFRYLKKLFWEVISRSYLFQTLQEVLELQDSFFSKKCLLDFTIVKTFNFFHKRADFSILVNISVKYLCFVYEKTLFSTTSTTLRSCCQNYFQKRRAFNVSTVGNISVHYVAYGWAIKRSCN